MDRFAQCRLLLAANHLRAKIHRCTRMCEYVFVRDTIIQTYLLGCCHLSLAVSASVCVCVYAHALLSLCRHRWRGVWMSATMCVRVCTHAYGILRASNATVIYRSIDTERVIIVCGAELCRPASANVIGSWTNCGHATEWRGWFSVVGWLVVY